MVISQLVWILENEHPLSIAQHGFCHNCSMMYHLVQLEHHIQNAFTMHHYSLSLS